MSQFMEPDTFLSPTKIPKPEPVIICSEPFQPEENRQLTAILEAFQSGFGEMKSTIASLKTEIRTQNKRIYSLQAEIRLLRQEKFRNHGTEESTIKALPKKPIYTASEIGGNSALAPPLQPMPVPAEPFHSSNSRPLSPTLTQGMSISEMRVPVAPTQTRGIKRKLQKNRNTAYTPDPSDPTGETVILSSETRSFKMARSDFFKAANRKGENLILLTFLDLLFRDSDGCSTLGNYCYSGSVNKQSLRDTELFKAIVNQMKRQNPKFDPKNFIGAITGKCMKQSRSKYIDTD